MGLYLAIDAGGTKAEYLLADDEHELGRVRSATIKRMRVSAEEAERNLTEGLAALEQRTGRSMAEITTTCIGTAGNTVPLVTDWLRAQFARRVGGPLLMIGDVEIALDAAYPGESGILILAGTGSNLVGRSAAGTLLGAGGYGPVLADQGSGHRIGLMALRAVFLAQDRQQPTQLTQAILEYKQMLSMNDLVAWANSCSPVEFSPLAPLVAQCAGAGDAVALDVLETQGRELAELALIVHRQLAALDGEGWHPRFAFAGSIVTQVMPLRRALEEAILRVAPVSEFRAEPVDPILGALWRARHFAASK